MKSSKYLRGAKRLQVLVPPLPWQKLRVKSAKDDSDVVVCLHGLWRSVWAMEPLANSLHQAGYTTVSVPYGSFRYNLEDIAIQVSAAVDSWIQAGRKVHFVTHSLGGVVLRQILMTSLKGHEQVNMGRVVMLAPPNHGSEIVDWLGKGPLKYLLGPAGTFLSSEYMAGYSSHFPVEIESAVIMGNRSALPLFRKLLEEENDGIVSVEKGRLEGVKEFKIVHADHTFISSEPEVLTMIQHFLKTGACEETTADSLSSE